MWLELAVFFKVKFDDGAYRCLPDGDIRFRGCTRTTKGVAYDSSRSVLGAEVEAYYVDTEKWYYATLVSEKLGILNILISPMHSMPIDM